MLFNATSNNISIILWQTFFYTVIALSDLKYFITIIFSNVKSLVKAFATKSDIYLSRLDNFQYSTCTNISIYIYIYKQT